MSGSPPKRSPLAPFASAAVAATVELCIMQPLDVVKTRMHLQGLGVQSGDNFGSTLGAIRGIRSAEGLQGLWRGFVPGLCVVIPRRGFKFVFYDAFLSLLWSRKDAKAPFVHSMAAGALAGGAEACIITPIECVKIAMQSEKATAKPTGALAFAASMARSQGVASLYAGLGATVAKHAAHSCFYFAAFHEVKKVMPAANGSKAREVAVDLAGGFVAGCAAATANNPFDVVKTRQQVGAAGAVEGHSAGAEFAAAKGRSLFSWTTELVKQEGVQALYKGYGAKVARLGPGSAIIFCVYNQVLQLF